jgi:DeoR family transcriptional regulator, ulaG and ulaABCDEF operon transcriptional repressor
MGMATVLEAERHRVILKLTAERSVLSVTDLVEILGASEATVRRDINALAEAGQLRRIRGGAEALQPRHEAHLVGVPFQLNEGLGAPEKRAIARAAVALIEDGDSIVINGGTSTYAMAEFLAERQLDILTNSIPLMIRLLASRNRIVMTGGTVFREQNIVLSPYEHDVSDQFWGQKLFISCFGLNRFGLMEADPLIVQAQQKLLRRAETLIVLADSRKLRQRSSMIVAPLERIATLITDEGASEEELAPYLQRDIRVIRAAVLEEDRDGAPLRHAGPA